MLTNIAGVQFQRAGKIYDFSYLPELSIRVGDEVVVEGKKGQAIARVCVLKFESLTKKHHSHIKSVLRLITQKPSTEEDPALKERVKAMVTELKINMKVVACQQQHSARKVIVYFTAPKRVDFRELVKRLASSLSYRIELRQIGPRDETKLLGGVGICGRQYCCSSFLREFVPVSIKMAKNQNLALNPSQVSGGCGRLLCCLTYENDVYTSLRSSLPAVGSRVEVTETDTTGVVVSLDILNQKLTIKSLSDEDPKRMVYPASQVRVLQGPAAKKKKLKQRERQPDLQESWGDDMDIQALMDFQQQGSAPKN